MCPSYSRHYIIKVFRVMAFFCSQKCKYFIVEMKHVAFNKVAAKYWAATSFTQNPLMIAQKMYVLCKYGIFLSLYHHLPDYFSIFSAFCPYSHFLNIIYFSRAQFFFAYTLKSFWIKEISLSIDNCSGSTKWVEKSAKRKMIEGEKNRYHFPSAALQR